jgi:hypothetical protein
VLGICDGMQAMAPTPGSSFDEVDRPRLFRRARASVSVVTARGGVSGAADGAERGRRWATYTFPISSDAGPAVALEARQARAGITPIPGEDLMLDAFCTAGTSPPPFTFDSRLVTSIGDYRSSRAGGAHAKKPALAQWRLGGLL